MANIADIKKQLMMSGWYNETIQEISLWPFVAR